MESLRQLHFQMTACRRCVDAGYTITPGAIFSGVENANVMVIGQAPGVTEVTAKRPFNAGSGRRLFNWLGRAGWIEEDFRQEQYMTAVTKCYPGKNDSGRGDRVPSKSEQALCRQYLEREMALVKPRLIIPVGGLAIKLFYPASAKLREVIGSGAYFAPNSLSDPVNFDLTLAMIYQYFEPELPQDGRWIVPLPHPSGASIWPNRPENRELIDRAIELLEQIRNSWNL